MNLCVTPGERKPVCVFDAQECLWSSVNLSNYEWFSMNADKRDLCEFSRKMKAFVLFFHSAKKKKLGFQLIQYQNMKWHKSYSGTKMVEVRMNGCAILAPKKPWLQLTPFQKAWTSL